MVECDTVSGVDLQLHLDINQLLPVALKKLHHRIPYTPVAIYLTYQLYEPVVLLGYLIKLRFGLGFGLGLGSGFGLGSGSLLIAVFWLMKCERGFCRSRHGM